MWWYINLQSFMVPAGYFSTNSGCNHPPPPLPRPQEGFIGGKEASCTLSGGLLNLTSKFVLPLRTIVQTGYLRARCHADVHHSSIFCYKEIWSYFPPSLSVFNLGLCIRAVSLGIWLNIVCFSSSGSSQSPVCTYSHSTTEIWAQKL